MADYSLIASNQINAAFWSALKAANILSESDYYIQEFDTYFVPIIPAQQIPEFNNLLPGKPYIFYDYEIKPIPENWWMTEETLYYSVLSTDYDQLAKILNFAVDFFRRYDKSATSVESLSTGTVFDFHYFKIDAITSPEAFKNEGGFRMGQIEVSYSYSRDVDYNNNGSFL